MTTNAFAGATSFSVTVLTVNEHFLWQAEELYKKALEIDPKHITTIYNYGGLLKNARHDWDGAEAMYKRALELDPRDVGTLCNYGTLLHDVRKRHDEAEAVYKQALEVGSADALAHSLTLTLARSLSPSLSLLPPPAAVPPTLHPTASRAGRPPGLRHALQLRSPAQKRAYKAPAHKSGSTKLPPPRVRG